MKRRTFQTVAVAILGCTSLAFAQSTAPTTQSTMLPPAAEQAPATTMPMAEAPTSAPVVPIDPTTPRGALKSLVSAMESGDTDKIKSLIATTSPSEDKMVSAMAGMSQAQKKFRDAANGAYGADAKLLTGDTAAASANGLARIDSAKETITGDSAVVDSGPDSGTPPITLNKTNGTWKIPIHELSRGVDPASINQRLDDLSFMTGLITDSATDIKNGTYKTPQDAGKAIQSKMMVAAMKRTAASQPATMPADAAPGVAPGAAPAPAGGGGM